MMWTSNYTHGSGNAWMTKLSCYGTEDDIAACPFPGWGTGGCQSSKYMNIGCGMHVCKLSQSMHNTVYIAIKNQNNENVYEKYKYTLRTGWK